MSGWAAKRFWTEVRVVAAGRGFTVALDGRPVRTPAKAALIVPTRAMAEAVAAEWDAQEGEIKPAGMPVTRAANAAIDKLGPQRREAAGMIAAYGDSDLLCYRAEAPRELAERQAAGWDPLLDWAVECFGARLETRTGVIHVPQPPEALERLAAPVHALDPFRLTALSELVALSGSLVIGLAAIETAFEAAELWRASRVDETWQEEKWGVDEAARDRAAAKQTDFLAAKRFHDLARDGF